MPSMVVTWWVVAFCVIRVDVCVVFVAESSSSMFHHLHSALMRIMEVQERGIMETGGQISVE